MDKPFDPLARVWTPHPGQAEFLENMAKIKVLSCGRRWGKSDVCAAHIVLSFLGPVPQRHLILAPTLAQARFVFDRVADLLDKLGQPYKMHLSPFPKLIVENHMLTARSGHTSRNLRGDEATNIVVDEAAFVAPDLISEIAMPMLATTDGTLILISTPNGMNHFWRFFELGQTGESGVWSRRGPSSENPRVTATFLDRQRKLISERAYAVEYEAQFIDSDQCLFRAEALDAMERDELMLDPEPVFVGIDWGRYRDFTAVAEVVGTREYAEIISVQRMNQLSYSQQTVRVANMLLRHQVVRVMCDKTGVGDPVLDDLRKLMPNTPIEGYGFTTASKAILMETLAMLIDQGRLVMRPNPELRRELQAYGGLGGGRLGGRDGIHDDLVTALALAVFQLPSHSAVYLSADKAA